MNLHSRKLLVVVAEAALEKRLIADLRREGAQGYTVHDVRGGSEHAVREGFWEADRTIELKVVCDEAVAQRLAAHVLAQYAPHFGVTLFLSDVAVFRPEKF
jgi:nitrogen regulatory protein P-II 2